MAFGGLRHVHPWGEAVFSVSVLVSDDQHPDITLSLVVARPP
jgi:hypothetical protein